VPFDWLLAECGGLTPGAPTPMFGWSWGHPFGRTTDRCGVTDVAENPDERTRYRHLVLDQIAPVIAKSTISLAVPRCGNLSCGATIIASLHSYVGYVRLGFYLNYVQLRTYIVLGGMEWSSGSRNDRFVLCDPFFLESVFFL
jgi:hypothetical protein